MERKGQDLAQRLRINKELLRPAENLQPLAETPLAVTMKMSRPDQAEAKTMDLSPLTTPRLLLTLEFVEVCANYAYRT